MKANFVAQTEGTMKKGYWLVAYRSVSDDAAVKACAALPVPALQPNPDGTPIEVLDQDGLCSNRPIDLM